MTENTELSQSLKEVVEELKSGYAKQQKSLVKNIAATVISAVIINIAATFMTLNGTVKINTRRLDKVEQTMTESAEHQKRFNEYVTILQQQHLNQEYKIKDNKDKIDKFMEYYSKHK